MHKGVGGQRAETGSLGLSLLFSLPGIKQAPERLERHPGISLAQACDLFSHLTPAL